MKIRSRIERLKDEILPPPQPPEFVTYHFVDSERNVVSTKVVELAPTRRFGRPRRTARRYPRAGGGW